MASLTVVPNPAVVATVVAVGGAGFANYKTRLLLDGVGASTNIFRPRRDGSFSVGITVSSTPKTQTLVAQQYVKSAWSEKARTSVVVQTVVEPPPPPPTGNVVAFPVGGTASQFISLLRDNTIDVIELSGTYRLPYMSANIERTRPVLVRPAFGGSAVFSGSNVGPDPQFSLGFGGVTSNINFDGITFDGFVLGQQGIVQMRDCHNMSFRNITARNSRANGSTAQPYHSWLFYVAASSTDWSTDLVFDQVVHIGTGRSMSSLAIDGGERIKATNWNVSHLYFAAHISPENGAPIRDLLLDTWAIADCGGPSWGYPNVSVPMENSAGIYRDLHATDSGVLLNLGSPRMTDGGGNSGL